ncbi:MAG: hypothetical protein ACRDCC_08295 [Culicoidibacterales bacterium]
MKHYDFAKLLNVSISSQQVTAFYKNEVVTLECHDSAILSVYHEQLFDTDTPVFIPFDEKTKTVILLEEGEM